MKNLNILQKTLMSIGMLCLIVMLFWYTYSVITGISKPNIVTWFILVVAVSLSFTTYIFSKNHSILENLANFVDLFLGWSVIITIIIFGKDIRFSINVFEVICIFLTIIISIFWRITKSHETSNKLL